MGFSIRGGSLIAGQVLLALVGADTALAQQLNSFGVLAGSTITNTGPTVISGNVGLSPGTAITGFPPGIVNAPSSIFAGDATAIQAQISLTAAYNDLANRPSTANLTGQDLGGQVLTPGVYAFNSSAQLTGPLTLNALGNPNALFIFNIGSALTTASGASVTLINGAQGANVFYRVGSSATLGTTTLFAGEILALTSITLNTGANISCGAALARNGAVTLDTNRITVCPVPTPVVATPVVTPTPGVTPTPVVSTPGITPTPAVTPTPGAAPTVSASTLPTTLPVLLPILTTVVTVPLATVLPADSSANQFAVARALDGFVSAGGTLPGGFQSIVSFLSPSDMARGFSQLSGEIATAAAPAGAQAMNSFLSMVLSPFDDYRTGPGVVTTAPPKYAKVPSLSVTPSSPRYWDVWAAAYGGQTKALGDVSIGSHDRSSRAFGLVTGLDVRLTPDTRVGFALAGGGTNFGLTDNLAVGRSDMFQAAVYGRTNFHSAYVAAALAYAWNGVSTDRYVPLAGPDHLLASYSANNFAGRLEGGYRIAAPEIIGLPGRGWITPYAAVQIQAFYTPFYRETSVGSSAFALAYEARTTVTTRTELGGKLERMIPLGPGVGLTLRTRAAWAHDEFTNTSAIATFQSLPGSQFIVVGAAPARDSLLLLAGAEIGFANGVALGGWFNSEQAYGSQTYSGSARLHYTW